MACASSCQLFLNFLTWDVIFLKDANVNQILPDIIFYRIHVCILLLMCWLQMLHQLYMHWKLTWKLQNYGCIIFQFALISGVSSSVLHPQKISFPRQVYMHNLNSLNIEPNCSIRKSQIIIHNVSMKGKGSRILGWAHGVSLDLHEMLL